MIAKVCIIPAQDKSVSQWYMPFHKFTKQI